MSVIFRHEIINSPGSPISPLGPGSPPQFDPTGNVVVELEFVLFIF
nr:MAG TPA: hypothetical protein [Caudoviricetes sp.]